MLRQVAAGFEFRVKHCGPAMAASLPIKGLLSIKGVIIFASLVASAVASDDGDEDAGQLSAAMLGVAAAVTAAVALAIGRACDFHADLVPAATVARAGRARGGKYATVLAWLALLTPVGLAVGAAASLGRAVDAGAGARAGLLALGAAAGVLAVARARADGWWPARAAASRLPPAASLALCACALGVGGSAAAYALLTEPFEFVGTSFVFLGLSAGPVVALIFEHADDARAAAARARSRSTRSSKPPTRGARRAARRAAAPAPAAAAAGGRRRRRRAGRGRERLGRRALPRVAAQRARPARAAEHAVTLAILVTYAASS